MTEESRSFFPLYLKLISYSCSSEYETCVKQLRGGMFTDEAREVGGDSDASGRAGGTRKE